MNTKLKNNIKEQLLTRNMSVSELERRAGLKQSTVQNILHDRSKNPSIDTIKSIAHELNCSIEELIGDISALNSVDHSLSKSVSDEDSAWNAKLYIKAIETIQTILDKKGVSLSKKQILASVDEVYKYSIGVSKEIDQRFAEWIIEKILPH